MRILQIEYARAVAAILVLLFHVEVTFARPKYMGESTLHFLINGDSGVQIFFVISGFVIYLIHHGDPEGSLANVRSFFHKRWTRVLIPLWIVATILFVTAKAGLTPNVAGFVDYLGIYFPFPLAKERVLSVAWTLRHEVLFYVIFAVWIWKRSLGWSLLLAWCALGLIIGPFMERGTAFKIVFNTNNFLFLAGIGLAHIHVRKIDVPFRGLVGAAGIGLFLLTCIGRSAFATPLWLNNIGYGIGAALFFVWFLRKPVGESAFALLLAQASYSLYLIHFPLLSVVTRVLDTFGGHEFLAVRLVYFAVSVVICIAASIVFHKYVEKPVLKMFRSSKPKNSAMPAPSETTR